MTKGAAGGPTTMSTPGPDGIWSPIRTRAAPSTVTPVEAPAEPMVRGYGAPLTEFTIWHIEPETASGIPLAVTVVWVMAMIAPVSGGAGAARLRRGSR